MSAAHHGKAYHGGEHYENFPVASWLLPPQMRAPVLALYRFARTADDIADEGSSSPPVRLARLESLDEGLREGPDQRPDNAAPVPAPRTDRADDTALALQAIAAALQQCLARAGLATDAARDLLSAFRQDVLFRAMAEESDVRDYCMRSAAPVGRMVLGFAGIHTTPHHARCMTASDHICTGLQLANFAQDMGEDLRRGRVYAPMTWWPPQWLAQSPVSESSAAQTTDTAVDGPVHHEPPGASAGELPKRMALWALQSLHAGRALPSLLMASGLPGRRRLALEIALTLQGGHEICRRVLHDPRAVWTSSPTIPASRLPVLMLRAIHALLMRDDA
jgi:phytoene/squalene synthetase